MFSMARVCVACCSKHGNSTGEARIAPKDMLRSHMGTSS
jgi:hypothetical protein